MEELGANCSQGHVGASSIDNTTLCSWGANGHGQLGQGHMQDQLLPVPITPHLLPREIQTGISCIGGGGGFSFILTGDGHLLMCGNNDRGQLGLDESSTGQGKTTPNVSIFAPCTFFAKVKVVKAASGWDFMLTLSDEGIVYSWGSNSFGQLGRKVDQSGKIKQSSTPSEVCFPSNSPTCDIATGLRHSLAVSAEGHVYAWGHGKKGQLGSEVKKDQGGKSVAALPQRVPVPCTVRIKTLFAGMYHSGALMESGNLFLWGCNAYGQCCIKPEMTMCVTTPSEQCIPCKDQESVVAVCSGWTHLVARTNKGNLYSWGRSNLGQLGRHCKAGCDPVPGLVGGLTGITSHMCGSEHNIALSDSSVYTWGWNEHGICATGDEIDVPIPRCVTSLNDYSLTVDGVWCGTGHTFTGLRPQS